MHPHQSHRYSQINGFNYLILLLVLLLIIFKSQVSASNDFQCFTKIDKIQAVKDPKNSFKAPEIGWEDVKLPDNWQSRWNMYSGTVWYRIKWRHVCPIPFHIKEPVLIALSHISMTGEIFSNGDLIWRDESINKKLSKSFNKPIQLSLPYSTLKDNNEILIRVVGIYHQIPGLGNLKLGSLNQIQPIYKKMVWQQRTSFFISAIISFVIGIFSFIIWILNKKEKALLFFSISCFLWVLFISNILLTVAFPFDNITSNSRINLIFLLWHSFYFCLFTWRFIEKKYKRAEYLIIIINIILSCFLLLINEKKFMPFASFTIFYWFCIFTVNCLFFQYLLLSKKSKRIKIISVILLVFLIIIFHDLYIIYNNYDLNLLGPYSSPIITLALSFIIAWRISDNIKKINKFNESLKVGIENG